MWVGPVLKKIRCEERKRCKGTIIKKGQVGLKLVFYYLEVGHRTKWVCMMCARAMLTRFIMDMAGFQGQLIAALSRANAETYTKHMTTPEAEVLKQSKEEEE